MERDKNEYSSHALIEVMYGEKKEWLNLVHNVQDL